MSSHSLKTLIMEKQEILTEDSPEAFNCAAMRNITNKLEIEDDKKRPANEIFDTVLQE
jgi:hypothetical protein